jgi:hypothetical protein
MNRSYSARPVRSVSSRKRQRTASLVTFAVILAIAGLVLWRTSPGNVAKRCINDQSRTVVRPGNCDDNGQPGNDQFV